MANAQRYPYLQHGCRHTALALQIRIPLCVGHAAVRAFDTHPIRAGRLQRGKLRWGGRPADPGPEDLAHCTEVQVLASLQEIDNGAVVPVIPHREEDVMAIVVALDYNLVRVAPQRCASPPALAPVHLIAQTDGKLAQIHLPFEGIEFAIPIHKNTFSFPFSPFSFPRRHGSYWPSAAAPAASLVRQLRGPHLSTCP